MKKTITVIKRNKANIEDSYKGAEEKDLLFIEIQKDTIGKSGSSPTWGEVYSFENGESKYKGIALHKEYDYDFPLAAYAEKIWQFFGKEILDDTVRVPDIDIVEQSAGQDEIISYRLMDNDEEDMIHIKDTLFHKFEREEMKAKKNIFTIDELLECVRLQIDNDENYKQIERDMIHVMLLDSITNNGDRHAFNWALVRNKKTSKYELAVFDHSSSFVDMLETRPYYAQDGWSTSYITVGRDKGRTYMGSDGKTIVEYISKEYPEYFGEFCDTFTEKLPIILENVKAQKMRIDSNRLTDKMENKRRFLRKLRNRGEIEYE